MNWLKSAFWKIFCIIDRTLKFPNLKKGEIGIQCGFDMDSPLTSDLFLMESRVGKSGKIVGIDPDPENIKLASDIIGEKKLNVILIKAALSEKPGNTTLKFGRKRGWNQLTNIPIDSSVEFEDKEIDIDVKPLAALMEENDIPFNKVRHINLTINGSEYSTLKGMSELLREANKLSLTVIAGRYDESGTIDGVADHILILDLLKNCGFRTRFTRIHQNFWWGFVVKFLMQRTNVYRKKNYGVIFAAKGKAKIPWYQSFS